MYVEIRLYTSKPPSALNFLIGMRKCTFSRNICVSKSISEVPEFYFCLHLYIFFFFQYMALPLTCFDRINSGDKFRRISFFCFVSSNKLYPSWQQSSCCIRPSSKFLTHIFSHLVFTVYIIPMDNSPI